MDHNRSASLNGDDGVGIPDDLRCKRSDGKQWRCTAKSMPDKTVCEKHYIQAKKRAANSAKRANLRKARRLGDSDAYLECNSDDFDASGSKAEVYHPSGKKASKGQVRNTPEMAPSRSLPGRNSLKPDDDSPRDLNQGDENWWSHRAGNVYAVDSSMNMSQRSFDPNAATEHSDGTAHSSEDIGGRTCHQCRRIERDGVVWCLKCDRRGYCSSCILSWYGDLTLEEIQELCPACRGTCNCKVCLRGGNLLKVRIREMPVLNKLRYLHSLLSAVLPIVKQIHQEQCLEVEIEKKIRGTEIDLSRTKLNVDEQMCCNLCRIPIIDYHRHCANCSYDLCLNCCEDLRGLSKYGSKGESVENQIGERNNVSGQLKVSRPKLNLSDKFPKWKGYMNGAIPCPPREYGGCTSSSLNLSRIFKMNWVAKLVKNAEEMVGGCRVYDVEAHSENSYSDNRSLLQSAHREDSDDNFLFCPSAKDIKSEGIDSFRKHWASGEPIIVRQVLDGSSVSSWDPIVIWKEIQEMSDEKIKDQNGMVKAINCFDFSEINIDLNQFMKGYYEGRVHANGTPELLKLKGWPSPRASEEFILYQRPEFISKLPLLEYIHSKWGLLNVAAKLPHYSLQNDVGPKIFIAYGSNGELGGGSSVTNLSHTMRDMVYLLVHTCEVMHKDFQTTDTEKLEQGNMEYEGKESPSNHQIYSDEEKSFDLSAGSQSENSGGMKMETNKDVSMVDSVGCVLLNRNVGYDSKKTHVGAVWDVFRRQDVPKLTEYLRLHWMELGKPNTVDFDLVTQSLYDEALFLNEHHKRKLKKEFGVEPWSFEHHLGQAVFVPAGCPFQVKNLMSNVQLGLDFLSPESLGEAARLAEEIRCLPNDHEKKLQVMEVGKISLYAASSVIKEVQKLVLDPKIGPELGFEDPNLTAAVSENLENMSRQRQISCS